MKCHAFLGDILTIGVDSRILVWNGSQFVPGGSMERLAKQDAMMMFRASRLSFMDPATVHVVEASPTSYVLVSDDSMVPFRKLVSSGLAAAYLRGAKTIAMSVHRSERRFPFVETDIDSVTSELSIGVQNFLLAMDKLELPYPEPVTLFLVSPDLAVFAGLARVFP